MLISVKVLSPLPKIFKHLDNYKYEKDVFSYEYAETNEKFNNVYHIILDGFQGNLFKLIDTNDYFTLNNFIFYENFYSKYRDTIYSNKNTFVGYDHTQEKKNFLQNDGWCNLLQQKKIFIEMYVRRNSNRKKCSDNFSTSKDVYEEFKKNKIKFKNPYFDIEDISTGNIFKIVFFNRLLPSSIFEILENFLSTDENKMFDPNMLKSKNFKKKLTINESDVSIISLMNYIKFFENEVNIKSYNTYKHLHLMLPHAPFLFNKKSLKKIKSRNMPNIESSEYFAEYIDQAYFSLKLVNNFMNILKKQKKFENSMIIIHADHGYDFVNSKNTYQKLNSDDYSDIESKSSSLLLIKYPANFKNIFNKNLNYQNEFVSKLILDNFKIENNIKLDGELIFYINNKEKIKKNPLNGKWEN